MKLPIVLVRVGCNPDGVIVSCWTCSHCGQAGEWISEYVKTERDAARHAREAHAQTVLA